MRRILDVEISGKRRRDRTNVSWKDACNRDVTKVEWKEDNATNNRITEEENKQSYQRPRMTGEASHTEK